MLDTRMAPYAALLLRLSLGILFLGHFALKLFVFTPAGSVQYSGSLGLPPAFQFVVMVWELLGALALIFGVWPRLAALALIPELAAGTVTIHGPAGFFFDNAYGGWEYPALWIVGLATLALIGDGPFALRPTRTPASVNTVATAAEPQQQAREKRP